MFLEGGLAEIPRRHVNFEAARCFSEGKIVQEDIGIMLFFEHIAGQCLKSWRDWFEGINTSPTSNNVGKENREMPIVGPDIQNGVPILDQTQKRHLVGMVPTEDS